MRKLTRRELALIFGAGALAGTAQGRMWRRSVRPGVVGLAEARAALGKPLGPEAARRPLTSPLSLRCGRHGATHFPLCRRPWLLGPPRHKPCPA